MGDTIMVSLHWQQEVYDISPTQTVDQRCQAIHGIVKKPQQQEEGLIGVTSISSERLNILFIQQICKPLM